MTVADHLRGAALGQRNFCDWLTGGLPMPPQFDLSWWIAGLREGADRLDRAADDLMAAGGDQLAHARKELAELRMEVGEMRVQLAAARGGEELL